VSSLHSQKIMALLKPLNVSPGKSQILSCDTVVEMSDMKLLSAYIVHEDHQI